MRTSIILREVLRGKRCGPGRRTSYTLGEKETPHYRGKEEPQYRVVLLSFLNGRKGLQENGGGKQRRNRFASLYRPG